MADFCNLHKEKIFHFFYWISGFSMYNREEQFHSKEETQCVYSGKYFQSHHHDSIVFWYAIFSIPNFVIHTLFILKANDSYSFLAGRLSKPVSTVKEEVSYKSRTFVINSEATPFLKCSGETTRLWI